MLDAPDEWEQVRADPDPKDDLGYEPLEWELIRTEQMGEDQWVFLPEDGEMLAEDAFIVADPDAVCDLATKL